MEAQTETQTYLEQGRRLLAQGQSRDAAIAYAHAAQLEPDNPVARLGLAEANLALGNYDIVRTASRHVQQLEPTDGIESMTAQALIDVLDKRYDAALQQVDNVNAQNPGIAYVHALRSYLLRLKKQDYDANLARARAARLSFGGRFENVFPAAEPVPSAYAGRPTYPPTPENNNSAPYTTGYTGPVRPTEQREQINRVDDNPYASRDATPQQQIQQPRQEREQVPPWTPPNRMRRQMIRTRFALSQYPNLITYTLIAINVIVWVISLLDPNIVAAGIQDNGAILNGEFWRIFTAMFLHDGIFHIGFNMLSLYFIGRGVEIFYGKWRYLVIYFVSGILGGLAYFAYYVFGLHQLGPDALGASGAIFGIFGAFGVFFIVNRRALGVYGRGAISNWIFWLGLNLVYGLLPGSAIAIQAHIGGLIAGMLLGFLLVPRLNNRRRI